MMILALVFLYGNLLVVFGDDEPFKCDDTEANCPSNMCFYSIDHEKRCYRAGCAEEELCRGRRNNECFISNSLHTCCCLEAGCAASYKGLNDCVDDVTNSTEAVTSVTDVMTRPTSASSIAAQTVSETQMSYSTTTPLNANIDKASTPITEGSTATSTEQMSIDARNTTTYALSSSTTDTRTTIAISTQTTAPVARTLMLQTTSATGTRQKERVTSRTTFKIIHPVTSPIQTQSTSTTMPKTTRYSVPTTTTKKITKTTTPTTTTTTSAITTTTASNEVYSPLEELHPLPDLSRTEFSAVRTPAARTAVVSDVNTATTRSAKPYLNMKVGSYAEQKEEIEPASFFSPALRVDQDQEAQKTPRNSSRTSGDEKKGSLISVYEVTTQAVKNRETQEEWKAPVPWWSAVVLGFLVSIITAWLIVIYLRRKRSRETQTSNKSTEKEHGLVDPLLKTSEENSRLSENSRI